MIDSKSGHDATGLPEQVIALRVSAEAISCQDGGDGARRRRRDRDGQPRRQPPQLPDVRDAPPPATLTAETPGGAISFGQSPGGDLDPGGGGA